MKTIKLLGQLPTLTGKGLTQSTVVLSSSYYYELDGATMTATMGVPWKPLGSNWKVEVMAVLDSPIDTNPILFSGLGNLFRLRRNATLGAVQVYLPLISGTNPTVIPSTDGELTHYTITSGFTQTLFQANEDVAVEAQFKNWSADDDISIRHIGSAPSIADKWKGGLHYLKATDYGDMQNRWIAEGDGAAVLNLNDPCAHWMNWLSIQFFCRRFDRSLTNDATARVMGSADGSTRILFYDSQHGTWPNRVAIITPTKTVNFNNALEYISPDGEEFEFRLTTSNGFPMLQINGKYYGGDGTFSGVSEFLLEQVYDAGNSTNSLHRGCALSSLQTRSQKDNLSEARSFTLVLDEGFGDVSVNSDPDAATQTTGVNLFDDAEMTPTDGITRTSPGNFNVAGTGIMTSTSIILEDEKLHRVTMDITSSNGMGSLQIANGLFGGNVTVDVIDITETGSFTLTFELGGNGLNFFILAAKDGFTGNMSNINIERVNADFNATWSQTPTWSYQIDNTCYLPMNTVGDTFLAYDGNGARRGVWDAAISGYLEANWKLR